MGFGFDEDLWDVVQLLVMTMVLAVGVYQWCLWIWVAVRRLGHGVAHDQMTAQCNTSMVAGRAFGVKVCYR